MITELVMLGVVTGAVKYSSKDRKIGDYELMLGYKNLAVLRKPIIVDMRTAPHLFVCGLSGNGKTKMIEFAVRNKKCVLLNCFKEDFKNVDAKRITGNDKILSYLKGLLNSIKVRDQKSTPCYVVIDEMLVLCMDKEITKAITDILAIGRHYNIFIVGISQIGTKESVKFKDLFNCRVCFKAIEESTYRTVLGYSPEDTKLRKREFFYYSDEVGKGKTYTIN